MDIVREQTISSTDLSMSEASGGVAASYFQGRQHALPLSWPSPVLRFMDVPTNPSPRPSRPTPRPSAASRPFAPHFRRSRRPDNGSGSMAVA